jgi:hypothetical protein
LYTCLFIFFLGVGRLSRALHPPGSYSDIEREFEESIGLCMTNASRRALDSAWERWEKWGDFARQEYPRLNIFAPPRVVYCTFVYYYLCLYKPSTVATYLKRINTAAKERGGGSLIAKEDRFWVRRVFRATAKKLGHDPSCKRLPLVVDILVQLRKHLDFHLYEDRLLWAIACVGVFTLARIGELVPSSSSELKVAIGSLSLSGTMGSIFLVGSKTDYKRQGITLKFFSNDSKCCPVSAMQAYVIGRPSTGPKSPIFIHENMKPVSQAWVVERLRNLLDKAGFEGKQYSGISLRRGGAQTLLKLHANDTVIMSMGRWTSSCFNRYLTTSDDERRSWQTRMASLTVPVSSKKRKK